MAALSRFLIALPCAAAIAAEEPLPERTAGEPFVVEPLLDLYDIPEPAAGELPPVDVARAEKNLERAKRKEQRWQQLQRSGVVSKVEAEVASQQVSVAALKLAQARVAHWRRQIETLRTRADKETGAAELLATAEASLRTAETLAADTEVLHRARSLELAQRNVERQQRLLALGIGSRRALARATEVLAKLKASEK